MLWNSKIKNSNSSILFRCFSPRNVVQPDPKQHSFSDVIDKSPPTSNKAPFGAPIKSWWQAPLRLYNSTDFKLSVQLRDFPKMRRFFSINVAQLKGHLNSSSRRNKTDMRELIRSAPFSTSNIIGSASRQNLSWKSCKMTGRRLFATYDKPIKVQDNDRIRIGRKIQSSRTFWENK